MKDTDLMSMMEKAGSRGITLPKNMSVLKTALLQKRPGKMPLIVKLVPLSAFVLVAAAAGAYLGREHNAVSCRVDDLGGVWCTFDDRHQGGNSTVWPPPPDNGGNTFVKSSPGPEGRGYAVRITGVAGTALDSARTGVSTVLSPRASCPECAGIDLTGFSGVRFNIKGNVDEGEVKFILPRQAVAGDAGRSGICGSLSGEADYEADITKYITPRWKRITLVFRKDLRQPELTRPEDRVSIASVLCDAKAVEWQYTRGNGRPFEMWIDDLEFF
jgi:hypothetical protein